METETKQAITWLAIVGVSACIFGPIGLVAAWVVCNESSK